MIVTTECQIRVLPDLLIKKIAAGEVVERPGSVVKELLENAVDAGATRIAVTIEEGGKQLIRVTDDGCGMSAEELRLAVAPHATSKIIAEDDLYSISTLGFRGEALASISSISKLRVVSRRPDSIEGNEIRVVADEIETAQAAGCPVGTTIEVRDLFFNVPARRKFLRTNSTETGHINEQLARLALAHPSIAFELTHNGKVRQNLPGCATLSERIAKFYGPELAAALLHIHRNERDVELEAYVAPPAQSRATAQWQYVFVNGRYIRDRYIQHAIKEAHRGLTEPNRHGVVFLFLTVNPRDVDVNVHPTKIEVRFADPQLIHSQVLSALRETFHKADLTPALNTNRATQTVSEAEQYRMRHDLAGALKGMTPIQPGSSQSPGHGGGETNSEFRIQNSGFSGPAGGRMDTGMDPARMWKSLYGTPPSNADRQPGSNADVVDAGSSQRGFTHETRRPRAIQMHNLYLVAETEEGIVIVDQHALHERVIYEQLRQRITTGSLQSQRLLLPETVSVTPQQAALLESSADLLTKLGLEITPFGSDSVAVQSFPALLKDTDVVSFMKDLIDFLTQQTGQTKPDVVIDSVLSMMACKAAVKAGDPLTPEEIDALFEKKELIDKSSSCPHGRPTTLKLTRADLDRQFHRT